MSARLVRVLPWDHNAYYDDLLLDAVPHGAETVLELGCGTGRLTRLLATRAGHVEAIDADGTMIAIARETPPPGNVACRHSDVMTEPLEAGGFDAIVSSAALHHLPLQPALRRFADALRPGGVLAAVALPRRDLPRELPVELAATSWHHTLGLYLTATGYRRRPELRHDAHHEQMPIRDPQLTTRQIRTTANEVLPGARVRRLLLWRYLLTWRKPPAA